MQRSQQTNTSSSINNQYAGMLAAIKNIQLNKPSDKIEQILKVTLSNEYNPQDYQNFFEHYSRGRASARYILNKTQQTEQTLFQKIDDFLEKAKKEMYAPKDIKAYLAGILAGISDDMRSEEEKAKCNVSVNPKDLKLQKMSDKDILAKLNQKTGQNNTQLKFATKKVINKGFQAAKKHYKKNTQNKLIAEKTTVNSNEEAILYALGIELFGEILENIGKQDRSRPYGTLPQITTSTHSTSRQQPILISYAQATETVSPDLDTELETQVKTLVSNHVPVEEIICKCINFNNQDQGKLKLLMDCAKEGEKHFKLSGSNPDLARNEVKQTLTHQIAKDPDLLKAYKIGLFVAAQEETFYQSLPLTLQQ